MPGISIYNKCNNKCIMCTNPDKFWKENKEFSLSCLLNRIDGFYYGRNEFLENFRDIFYITGGEPTLSPYLFTIIEKINTLFKDKKINCLSNGRMFCYASYVKEFFKSGSNLELTIPIHGHSADLHDRITGVPGSFFQTVKGIENIFRFKKSTNLVEIRVVIHKVNYKFLNKIIKFIKSEFPKINRLVFIFFEIEGQALKNINALKLTYSDFLPYIGKLCVLPRYFPDVRFYHFPLCMLPVKFFPYVWRTLPSFEVAYLDKCKLCNLKKLCLGVHKGYLKYFGGLEFRANKKQFTIQESNNWHHPIKK